jgi:Uma2 family endonuclease
VIFEIMSQETAELDSTLKLLIYTNSPSLRAYVLVSTARRLIVFYHRLTSRATWNTEVLKEYDEVVLFEVGIFAFVRSFYENFDESKPPELLAKVVSRPRQKPVQVQR